MAHGVHPAWAAVLLPVEHRAGFRFVFPGVSEMAEEQEGEGISKVKIKAALSQWLFLRY